LPLKTALYALEVMSRYFYIVLIFTFSCSEQSKEITDRWFLVDGGFTKATINTAVVEEKLWLFLNSRTEHEFFDREDYTFQYRMLTDNEVRIQGFCEKLPIGYSLNKDFLAVRDGGTCVIHIRYLINSEMFKDFYVNGVA
jgi:hypothetical protein